MQNSSYEFPERDTAGLNYDDVKRDVASRLRNACAGWPKEDFEAIVEKVTLTTMKYPSPRRFVAD